MHICRHATHGADASDQLCISVILFGFMPVGARSKDALQSFHHLVAQAAFTTFTHHSPPQIQDLWFLSQYRFSLSFLLHRAFSPTSLRQRRLIALSCNSPIGESLLISQVDRLIEAHADVERSNSFSALPNRPAKARSGMEKMG
jgi:hypothetical protein